ncbi:hypothetical protein [Streptococcus suis]|nr:hypothetical protein [Streptococcus suis]NQN59224.1 hypothetical protein [Streptococcus suis]
MTDRFIANNIGVYFWKNSKKLEKSENLRNFLLTNNLKTVMIVTNK